MHKTIISDTSCFIVLKNIGELDLLQKVYGKIITTPEIAEEFGEELPNWVSIIKVKDKSRQLILEMQIDKGESSAIALAMETLDCTVILDDYKARVVAEKLGLTITGTIGVIIKAKLNGIIVSIKPMLAKLRKTEFRFSDEVEQNALKAANE